MRLCGAPFLVGLGIQTTRSISNNLLMHSKNHNHQNDGSFVEMKQHKHHVSCGLQQSLVPVTAQARTLDAEFLRVLAGTHNVSEAFRRAGLAQGAQSGWLLHIPNIDEPHNDDEVTSSAQSLLSKLGLTSTEDSLRINQNGAEKLGVTLDGETEPIRIEAALIGHILLADVNSSQQKSRFFTTLENKEFKHLRTREDPWSSNPKERHQPPTPPDISIVQR